MNSPKIYQNQDVFFAYMDILGFKNLILNNENEYLSNLYTDVLDKIVLKGITNRKSEYFGDDARFAMINSLVISDSIMLWTNHDNIWGLLEITEATRIILSEGMKAGIPLRGIVTKGPIIFQKKENENHNFDVGRITLVGKALVKAYTEEGIYDWSGCVISEDCINLWKNGVIEYYLKDARKHNIYVDYLSPVKNKNKEGEVVIEEKMMTSVNWTSGISRSQVEWAFSAHNKGTDKRKLIHTLLFYDQMMSLE
ncbi:MULTISPECIES: hypothetical protein [unclassified Paenibacillus]|uniref:hypothetical protein n=1 Tax=unclassified Paenibacillus TaxID=185978 RepID=UPI001AE52955|nr:MULTISPECIES: hypothetical protein [unclassified Paenibacillus]MBP1154643.1 hypothetical protein [Paenibacillus sp. PvP091]MBP1169973.1 hypothetical protein [Paenibacillus sp. PvR098]MBP2441001.1 hypothetical protein [Paenibacillus sp. PvP052]